MNIVATVPHKMNPERLREVLGMLGWGQRSLSERLGINATTTRRWATGEQDVPPHVARWLEELAADVAKRQARAVKDALAQRPLPAGWSAAPPAPRGAFGE